MQIPGWLRLSLQIGKMTLHDKRKQIYEKLGSLSCHKNYEEDKYDDT